jgi:hypothetical protein
MPPSPREAAQVRRFVRTAFLFLVFGMLLGLHVSSASYMGWGTVRAGYIVAHTHVLLVGFLLTLLLGILLWVLPAPEPEPARLARLDLAYWLLVVGVVGRTTSEILHSYWALRPLGLAIFSFSSLELVAVVLFGRLLLQRIRVAA